MDKENKIFRKKIIESLNSPTELGDYLKVVNIPGWIIIAASLILIAGFVVWCYFAEIEGGINPITLIRK